MTRAGSGVELMMRPRRWRQAGLGHKAAQGLLLRAVGRHAVGGDYRHLGGAVDDDGRGRVGRRVAAGRNHVLRR
jgi:hypothetical protein